MQIYVNSFRCQALVLKLSEISVMKPTGEKQGFVSGKTKSALPVLVYTPNILAK